MKISDAAAALAALAHESRLTVFRLLVGRGPSGYTPTEISARLRIPAPTLSFHLKELQHARLVEMRRDGRCRYYRPNFPHMKQLLAFLTDHCCDLADTNCDPKCGLPATAPVRAARKRA